MRRDWAAEDGVVAGAEALAFGVLIFVIGTLIAVNAWAIVDTKVAANAAAREAARLVVESDPGDDLQGRAQQVAEATVAGFGKDLVEVGTVAIAGALQRCARVTVTVPLTLPTVRLPLVGGFGGDVEIRGSHSELVDPLRSGLPAGGSCEV